MTHISLTSPIQALVPTRLVRRSRPLRRSRAVHTDTQDSRHRTAQPRGIFETELTSMAHTFLGLR